MIQCYVHHLTLSCGCEILAVQARDGSFSRLDARRNLPGDKTPITLTLSEIVLPGSRPVDWVFNWCPVPSCGQPGGPWTEPGPPVCVVEDRVHAVHDADQVPDGAYIGDLCCCSRTCPHGYWARVGKAKIKMEQLDMFE